MKVISFLTNARYDAPDTHRILYLIQGLKFPFFPGGKFLPPHIFLGGKLIGRGGK